MAMRKIIPLYELDLLEAIDHLPDRLQSALRLRYGIGCQPHTMKAGGSAMGIHAETFSQKVNRAKRNIFAELKLRRYGLTTTTKPTKKYVKRTSCSIELHPICCSSITELHIQKFDERHSEMVIGKAVYLVNSADLIKALSV
jgi:hypothetical protein